LIKDKEFNRDDFDENSINLDNEWMPMKPGKELVYKGYDVNEDGEKEKHSILYTITDFTKMIDGVNAVVLFERENRILAYTLAYTLTLPPLLLVYRK
jgi:hypothetical protein